MNEEEEEEEEEDVGGCSFFTGFILGQFGFLSLFILLNWTTLTEGISIMWTRFIIFFPTLLFWLLVVIGVGLVVFFIWAFICDFLNTMKRVSELEEELGKEKEKSDRRREQIYSLESRSDYLEKNVKYLLKELKEIKTHTGLEAKQEVKKAADNFIEWA